MITYETNFCDDCDKECETKMIRSETVRGPDHVHGGAIWEPCDWEVSVCCEANFFRGHTDENGKPCTKDGKYFDQKPEVKDEVDTELSGDSYQPQ